jgi:hypothetical protein
MITSDDAGGKLAPRITGRIQVSRPDPSSFQDLILNSFLNSVEAFVEH